MQSFCVEKCMKRNYLSIITVRNKGGITMLYVILGTLIISIFYLWKKIKKLERRDRVKTEFFMNITHDMRNHLNIILNTSKLIGLKVDKNLNDRIIALNQSSYGLLKLINNLIDMTKVENEFYSLNLENHNIVDAVEEIVQSVSCFIKDKGIDIIFDTEIEEKIMAFDKEKIERIMLNLLSNGAKFTPSGGRIEVNIYEKSSEILISVKDNGVGIEKEKQKYIFQRYKQVKEGEVYEYGGSGIGLSLVKSFVEMHGGRVTLCSDYGRGSEFLISLPCKIINNEECRNINNFNVEMAKVEFSEVINKS